MKLARQPGRSLFIKLIYQLDSPRFSGFLSMKGYSHIVDRLTPRILNKGDSTLSSLSDLWPFEKIQSQRQSCSPLNLRTIGWKSWTKWTPFQGTVPHSSHWMVIIFVMFPLRSRTLVPAPRLWPPVPRAGAGWDATRPLEKNREKWWVNGIWMGFSGIQWTLDGDLTGQWWCHGIYIGFSGSWWDLNGDSMGYEWLWNWGYDPHGKINHSTRAQAWSPQPSSGRPTRSPWPSHDDPIFGREKAVHL